MAKGPKITTGTGSNVGFSREYSNTPEGKSQIENLLRKIKEAEEKNITAQSESANAQQDAAEKIEVAAENLSEASEKIIENTQEQIKLNDTVKNYFNSFKSSFKQFADSFQSQTNDNTEAQPGRASRPGRLNSLDEKLNTLIDINQNILNATLNNNPLLYDILQALLLKSAITGGGGKGGGRGGNTGGGPTNPPRGRGNGGGGGGGVGGALAGAGGFLGGAGGMLGGIGKLLAGGALATLLFSATDAKSVKANVETLLSIGEGYENRTEFLKDGGALTLALAGIGTGLAVFGIGQAAVGLAQFITDEKWTETLKNNVNSLLSISDSMGGNWEMLKDGGAFTLAMTGIGIGLGVFGIGQAAVGLAQFISSDDWAKKVLDNVTTLLSISNLDGVGWDTAKFVLVMGGIATGLAAFAVGQGAAVAADALDKTYQMFTGEGGFADRILSNVQKLLSITSLPGVGADTAGFAAVMGGIAAGLVAFAFGKGANVAVDELDAAFAHFTGQEPFADRIYNQVAKLLSITQIQTGDGKSFVATMTDIVAGLTVFTAGNFVDTLLSIGTKLLSFLSGKESPIDRVLQLADNAENLTKGADALQKIASALTAFSNIKTGNLGDIDFEGLAKNLGKAIPTLQALAKGGKIGGGIFGFGEIDFGKGILDPELRLDEMADAIGKINYVLGRTTSPVLEQVNVPPPTMGNQNAFNAASSSFSTMAAAGPPPVVNVNNNNVTNNTSAGGSGDTKIGGNIITSPPQSHIDRSMYGWNDLHSATP
jgi:hypothetical protein